MSSRSLVILTNSPLNDTVIENIETIIRNIDPQLVLNYGSPNTFLEIRGSMTSLDQERCKFKIRARLQNEGDSGEEKPQPRSPDQVMRVIAQKDYSVEPATTGLGTVAEQEEFLDSGGPTTNRWTIHKVDVIAPSDGVDVVKHQLDTDSLPVQQSWVLSSIPLASLKTLTTDRAEIIERVGTATNTIIGLEIIHDDRVLGQLRIHGSSQHDINIANRRVGGIFVLLNLVMNNHIGELVITPVSDSSRYKILKYTSLNDLASRRVLVDRTISGVLDISSDLQKLTAPVAVVPNPNTGVISLLGTFLQPPFMPNWQKGKSNQVHVWDGFTFRSLGKREAGYDGASIFNPFTIFNTPILENPTIVDSEPQVKPEFKLEPDHKGIPQTLPVTWDTRDVSPEIPEIVEPVENSLDDQQESTQPWSLVQAKAMKQPAEIQQQGSGPKVSEFSRPNRRTRKNRSVSYKKPPAVVQPTVPLSRKFVGVSYANAVKDSAKTVPTAPNPVSASDVLAEVPPDRNAVGPNTLPERAYNAVELALLAAPRTTAVLRALAELNISVSDVDSSPGLDPSTILNKLDHSKSDLSTTEGPESSDSLHTSVSLGNLVRSSTGMVTPADQGVENLPYRHQRESSAHPGVISATSPISYAIPPGYRLVPEAAFNSEGRHPPQIPVPPMSTYGAPEPLHPHNLPNVLPGYPQYRHETFGTTLPMLPPGLYGSSTYPPQSQLGIPMVQPPFGSSLSLLQNSGPYSYGSFQVPQAQIHRYQNVFGGGFGAHLNPATYGTTNPSLNSHELQSTIAAHLRPVSQNVQAPLGVPARTDIKPQGGSNRNELSHGATPPLNSQELQSTFAARRIQPRPVSQNAQAPPGVSALTARNPLGGFNRNELSQIVRSQPEFVPASQQAASQPESPAEIDDLIDFSDNDDIQEVQMSIISAYNPKASRSEFNRTMRQQGKNKGRSAKDTAKHWRTPRVTKQTSSEKTDEQHTENRFTQLNDQVSENTTSESPEQPVSTRWVSRKERVVSRKEIARAEAAGIDRPPGRTEIKVDIQVPKQAGPVDPVPNVEIIENDILTPVIKDRPVNFRIKEKLVIFKALEPILNACHAFPGISSLEIQFGLALTRLQARPEHMSRNKLCGLLERTAAHRSTELEGPYENFFNRLTTSPDDVEHIIDAQADGSRIFERAPIKYHVKYEFLLRNSRGVMFVLTVSAHGAVTFREPDTELGSLRLYFPGNIWDASVVISSTLEGGMNRTDPEAEKAAHVIASSLWVEPGNKRVRLIAAAPNVPGLVLEKVVMKRYTQHRYIDPYNSDTDLRLQVTEVQDLIITPHPDSIKKLFEARCARLEEMVSQNRQFWEASVMSPIINSALNIKHEGASFGQWCGKWASVDVFGHEAEQVLTGSEKIKIAEHTVNKFPRVSDPPTQLAKAIGTSGLGDLMCLAEVIVGKMDIVGYGNHGPAATPGDIPKVNESGDSVPPVVVQKPEPKSKGKKKVKGQVDGGSDTPPSSPRSNALVINNNAPGSEPLPEGSILGLSLV